MKQLSLILLVAALVPMAQADKATDNPACADIAKQCESANFKPGDHKKTGKGLWVDCVRAVAKGNSVPGVTATQQQAKDCIQSHKAQKTK